MYGTYHCTEDTARPRPSGDRRKYDAGRHTAHATPPSVFSAVSSPATEMSFSSESAMTADPNPAPA